MSANASAVPRVGHDSSRAFSVQIIVGLVAVGILSFAAFIVLNAFADDMRKPDNGGTHALSKSAIGFAGFVSLLQGEGRRVRLSRGPVLQGDAHGELMVFTPERGQAIGAENVAGARGGVLIVLPKWNAWTDFRHPGWVRSDGLGDSNAIERTLEKLDHGFTVGQAPGAGEVILKSGDGSRPDLPAGRIERLQTMVSADIEPILADSQGHAVLGRLTPDWGVNIPITPPPLVDEELADDETGDEASSDNSAPPEEEEVVDPEDAFQSVEDVTNEFPETGMIPAQAVGGGAIYVLSEPDLLNTKGLASAVTAKAGLQVFQIIAERETPVAFDVTLHGMERSRNFMKLLLEPPFLPAVLCLAFAGALMAVNSIAGQMRIRSGREIALGKATLVENSALLVSMAGREAHMGRRYVAMTRALAAVAAGVPPRSSEAQQTAMLDAAGGPAREASFSKLADEVTKAETPSALAQAANRLFRWRQEIGREHRRR